MQRIFTSFGGALVAVVVLATTVVAQDFSWQGPLAPGQSIEIKGVNGDIRAEPAISNAVEVSAEKHARRDDPSSVQIQVVPHAGGVTICAVYPSPDASRPNECAPGDAGRMNVQNLDVTVRFTVRVLAGVGLMARTVNGEIRAMNVSADLTLSTVNGSIDFSTSAVGSAKTVNGSIKGTLGRADWSDRLSMSTVNGSIGLTLPATLSTELHAVAENGDVQTDFPVMVTRTDRRRVDGTIGGGGRTLSLECVNGTITLRRE